MLPAISAHDSKSALLLFPSLMHHRACTESLDLAWICLILLPFLLCAAVQCNTFWHWPPIIPRAALGATQSMPLFKMMVQCAGSHGSCGQTSLHCCNTL